MMNNTFSFFMKRHISLEMLALIIVFIIFANLFINWQTIDEPVPTHFNASGAADAWGSKNSLLLLPFVSLSLYILLTIVEFYPRLWNFPIKVSEANQNYLVAIGLDMLIVLKCLVLFIFLGNIIKPLFSVSSVFYRLCGLLLSFFLFFLYIPIF